MRRTAPARLYLHMHPYMHPHMHRHMAPHPRARGAALVISLMMLAVILVLGLASMRLATTEERMAGYTQDRQLAFQAAEAALRELEDRVAQDKPVAPSACGSAPSLTGPAFRICPAPAPSSLPRWMQPAADEWGEASPVGPAGAQITPRYLLEHLGSQFACDSAPGAAQDCSQYRITVRAGGGSRAEVMLQSLYLSD